jgi:hypothetical protein
MQGFHQDALAFAAWLRWNTGMVAGVQLFRSKDLLVRYQQARVTRRLRRCLC